MRCRDALIAAFNAASSGACSSASGVGTTTASRNAWELFPYTKTWCTSGLATNAASSFARATNSPWESLSTLLRRST